MVSTPIPERLKRYRQAVELRGRLVRIRDEERGGLQRIATGAGVDLSVLYRVIHGHVPRPATLRKIAAALNGKGK